MPTKTETPTPDNDTPYAIAYARPMSWGSGAELRMVMRRVDRSASLLSRVADIETHAYCSPDFAGFYGQRIQLADSSHLELHDLERIIKPMRAIHAKLAAMDRELGYAASFAEFCRRAAVAAGVRHVYIEPGYNAGNKDHQGRQLSSVFDLRCYDPKRDGNGFLYALNALADGTVKERGKQPDAA
jgi:hypothetical protein